MPTGHSPPALGHFPILLHGAERQEPAFPEGQGLHERTIREGIGDVVPHVLPFISNRSAKSQYTLSGLTVSEM